MKLMVAFYRWRGSLDHERGAEIVEYAILLMLIALVCIATITLIGEDTSEPYSSLASGITG